MNRNRQQHVLQSAEIDCYVAALAGLKLSIPERYGTARSLHRAAAYECPHGNLDTASQYSKKQVLRDTERTSLIGAYRAGDRRFDRD
jgi:hypothetical protein